MRSLFESEEKLRRSLPVQIEIDHFRVGNDILNYAMAGAGEPLILIHGGTIGWGQWYPNLAELAKYYRVYALDLPGGGRSYQVDYAKLDLNRDILEKVEGFLGHLNLPAAHVVGSSIGGWVAAKLAARNNQYFKKLVLVDSVGFSNYMRFTDRLMSFFSLAKLVSKTILRPKRENPRIEGFLRSVFLDARVSLRPEFVDYFYETMSHSHNLLFISRLAKHVVKGDLALDHDLPKIRNKALIMWGSDDKLTPVERAQPSFHLLANARVEIIPGSGHIPSLEKPEIFNRIVLDFLQNDSHTL